MKMSGLACAAADLHLVGDERFDVRHAGRAVFLRIEGVWIGGKKFADAFRVGDAQFRREIDLADAFGDAGLDGFVRKAGRAMQNQRDVNDFADFLQAFDIQFRFDFIDAVGRSDGDRK